MAQGEDLQFQIHPATESAGKNRNDRTRELSMPATLRPPMPELWFFTAFGVFSRHKGQAQLAAVNTPFSHLSSIRPSSFRPLPAGLLRIRNRHG